jgi:hypothetical protein
MKKLLNFGFLGLLIFILLLSCKKENNNDTPPIEEEFMDPPLSEIDLQILDDSSIDINDYLDSLFDINGVSYRTLFNDPDFINEVNTGVANFRTNFSSVSEQIKIDINKMLTHGGFLVAENRKASNIRPRLSDEEPAQQLYGYLQVNKNSRQLNLRVKQVLLHL